LDPEISTIVDMKMVTSESHGKAPIIRAARQYLINTFNKNHQTAEWMKEAAVCRVAVHLLPVA
jgi:hypothetical protein